MGKVIRLTENDLIRIVKKIIGEQTVGGGTNKGITPQIPKPQDQFIRQVVFYSDRAQKNEAIRGWINLREWDNYVKKATNTTKQHRGSYENLSTIVLYGSIYRDENAARSASGGERVTWNFQATNGFGIFMVGQKYLYCETLNVFLRDRYLQKNKSGAWIVKVAPGGFAINNSAGIPNNFA